MGVNVSKVLFSVGAGGAATFLMYTLLKSEKPVPEIRSGLLGLKNCGSTCFLNAVLQAYASCRYIQGWLAVKEVQNANQTDMYMPFLSINRITHVNYPMIAAMYRAILVINRNINNFDDDVYSAKVPADVLFGLRFNGHRIGLQQEQDAFEVFQLIASVLNHEVEKSLRRNADASIDDTLDTSLESLRDESYQVFPWSVKLDGTEETISGQDMGWGLGPNGDWVRLGSPMRRLNKGIYSRRLLRMKCDYRASPKPPFRFTMFSQMKCIVCMQKTPVRLEAAESLTLPLPSPIACVGIHVKELIQEYMKPGLVHNVDCETCSMRACVDNDGNVPEHHRIIQSSFSKYNYIAKLPKTLVIHIPRCTWGPLGMIKRTEHIRFDEMMNLAGFRRLYDPKKKSLMEEENEVKDFSVERCENIVRRYRNSEYRLVAVISHVGDGVDNGHYVTFRRNACYPTNYDKWFYCSDETVRSVSFSTVAATKAYMLFYEKTHIPA